MLAFSNQVAVPRYNSWNKWAAIFGLEFSSGLPFFLILSTMSIWCAESGVTPDKIGFLAWATSPYVFKFAIAYVVDATANKFFKSNTNQFRKNLIIISQLFLLLSIYFLSGLTPNKDMYLIGAIVFVIATFSSLQDLLVESVRIQFLRSKVESSVGVGISVVGYRLGTLTSSTLALYIAHSHGWGMAYKIVGFGMMVGIISAITFKHKYYEVIEDQVKLNSITTKANKFSKDIFLIIGLIFILKIQDIMLNSMTNPFLVLTGFSKLDIANISKLFGTGAIFLGSIVASYFLYKFNLFSMCVAAVLFQGIAALLFIFQSYLGDSLNFLWVSIGFESFAAGISQATFLAFISSQCRKELTSWDLACYTSLGSLARIIITNISGEITVHLNWQNYFTLISLLSIPVLMLLYFYKNILRIDYDN